MEKKKGRGRPRVTEIIAGENFALFEEIIIGGTKDRSQRSISDLAYVFTAANILSEVASEIEDLELLINHQSQYVCRSILNQLGRMYRTEGYSKEIIVRVAKAAIRDKKNGYGVKEIERYINQKWQSYRRLVILVHSPKLLCESRFIKLKSKIGGKHIMAELKIIKMSDIQAEPVTWLWEPYIPCGKITIVQGDPGDGKTTMMLAIAAAVTNGEALPNGIGAAPANVIVQTAEDGLADTMQMAENEGISIKTLKRAKAQLGVVSRKRGEQWYWEMPEIIYAKFTNKQEGQEGQIQALTPLSFFNGPGVI